MLATICSALLLATSQSPLAPLHLRGTKFVDARGHEVILRGVNLGGWLVEEPWMTPFATSPTKGGPEVVRDHVTLWAAVERKVGHDGMLRVRNAYRDNWITDEDFGRIRAAGFNHVRIPFIWSLLDEKGGMQRLQWAVDSAAKHGLYSVLDMHGLPGGQSVEDHTGESGRNHLWTDPANKALAEKCWAKLAKHFAGNPDVAAFDLINEPMGVPNLGTLYIVFDRLVRAVHKVAPGRIVLIEDGYNGFDTTPDPRAMAWEPAAFSLHFYNFDAKTEQDHGKALLAQLPALEKIQRERNAPVYAGEFNVEPHGTPAATLDMIKGFEGAGWSWAMWTFKTMAPGGPMGQWGLYRADGPAVTLDPFKDSEQQMIAKTRAFRTDHMKSAPGLVEALRAYLAPHRA